MSFPQFIAKSLTELLAIRVRDGPGDPYIYTAVPEPEGKLILRHLTYAQTQRAVDRLAAHYATIPDLLPEKDETGIPPVRIVGVWTSSTIDETLLEIALAKLGLTALLLSINNSVAAVAHMLSLTKSVHLIYGPGFSNEVLEVQNLLRTEKSISISLIPDQRFPIWGHHGVDEWQGEPVQAVLTPEQETPRPAVILHSSGSTGFPKPIYISHYGMIANIAINQNLPALTTLPVFHGYGHFALFRCMYSHQPVTLFPGHLPLTIGNVSAVMDAREEIAKRLGETHGGMRQCFAVPYVITLMGETEEGVKRLASFDLVSFAGAPLPDDLGDRLTASGVNILAIYGTTETGSLMNTPRDFATDKLWNWLAPIPGVIPYLVMEPRGLQKTDGGQEMETFESVVKDGYPPKIESNRPDKSYATKDLFLQHPEFKNRYRYIGRLDDTLVHILGEKTNPVPMELCIRGNSPLVQEVIVFGANRPQTGCLILPSKIAEDEGFLNKDGTWKEVQLLEKIWPVIEQANRDAPTHSRLLPEMVVFFPPNTHIPVATKMSILRPACYTQFADLINETYDRFESTAHSANAEAIDFQGSQTKAEEYLLQTFQRTLGPSRKSNELDPEWDLFEFGVDSLQATRVRNTIMKEVRLNGATLGQNVVYECGSIRKLASHILSKQYSADSSPTIISEHRLMEELVEKWTTRVIVPPRQEQKPESLSLPEDARVVLLTGATGSLGAHILWNLVRSDKVRKVITLSRAKDHEDSFQRIEASLKARRLDDILTDSKLKCKILSYAGNASANLLDLTSSEYDSLRAEVTDVIHNAWPVNFVLPLSAYDVHIGGFVNLLNLAMSSSYNRPANFYFSSSISSSLHKAKSNGKVQDDEDPVCSESFSQSTETAVATGYARSKWIVEKICERVGQTLSAGSRIRVLRIGQMAGDSVNGIWNETEAWPLMFKSAEVLRALPDTSEQLSWLPVDIAARSIAEIVLTNSSTDVAAVYHILNPNRITWSCLLGGLEASGLKFTRVKGVEWVRMLESSLREAEQKGPEAVDNLGKKNPAVKLVSFFNARYSSPSSKSMHFLTDKTIQVSSSIRDASAIGDNTISNWVKCWRQSGFLHTISDCTYSDCT